MIFLSYHFLVVNLHATATLIFLRANDRMIARLLFFYILDILSTESRCIAGRGIGKMTWRVQWAAAAVRGTHNTIWTRAISSAPTLRSESRHTAKTGSSGMAHFINNYVTVIIYLRAISFHQRRTSLGLAVGPRQRAEQTALLGEELRRAGRCRQQATGQPRTPRVSYRLTNV